MTARARTLASTAFCLPDLLGAKGGATVSVCLPARDEAATVGRVVAAVVEELMELPRPLVDEVVVVDDRSTDGTAAAAAAAGATVVHVDDVLPAYGPGTGKGDAMWKSLAVARGDVVVWCDADVRNFEARFVLGLLGPLLLQPQTAFVKGFYRRPLHGRDGEGGRVTELVARPLLSLLFPQLTAIEQPLSGECAGRRAVLERLPFVQGYGVDLALLLDVVELVGLHAVAQVDLGTRVHRNRPLDELSPQAMAVLQTALRRAGVPWRDEWSSVLRRPGREPLSVEVRERPPLVTASGYPARTS